MSKAQIQDGQSYIPNNSNKYPHCKAQRQQTVQLPNSTLNNDKRSQTCNQKLPTNSSNQIVPIKILRSIMNQVCYWIFNIADRNKVYKCNYIHLHIPLAITIRMLQVQMINSKDTYIKIFLNTLIKKINDKQQMLHQISDKKYREEIFNTFLKLIINKNTTLKELIKFLRNFLLKNKDIMMSFMPYYYDFFALVVNKQDVFMSNKPQQALIQYTIGFQHDKFYNKNFKRDDIQQMIRIFQDKLAQKYHCIQA